MFHSIHNRPFSYAVFTSFPVPTVPDRGDDLDRALIGFALGGISNSPAINT